MEQLKDPPCLDGRGGEAGLRARSCRRSAGTKKGRWQYRYSDQAVLERERRKYEKLVAFGRPCLPAQGDRSIPRSARLACERVLGWHPPHLSTCFMRPGSEVYAKENGSFGDRHAADRHASVHGDTVALRLHGEVGKRQVRELHDRRVARMRRG